MWHMDQFSVKEFLFISRTHDTKRTMKENQYEANRKRTHSAAMWTRTYKKKFTHKKQHG